MKYSNNKQQEAAQYFIDNIAEVTNIAKALKHRVQSLIEAAIKTKLYDEEGTCGCRFINSLDANFETTKTLNMVAIRNYIAFVCSEGAIQTDDNGVPILDEDNFVLRPLEVAKNPAKPMDRNNKKTIYRPVQDKVETGETKTDSDGNEVKKTKKVTRVLNETEVLARMDMFKWWAFQPAAPKKAYKGKLFQAIKADLKAKNAKEYLPETEEAKFLEAVAALAAKHGFSDKITA